MRTTEREIMIGLSPNNVRGDDREKIKPKANEGKYFLFLRSTKTYFCVVQKLLFLRSTETDAGAR